MANQTNFVIAVVAYDNRCPLNDDVSNQVKAALTEGIYEAKGVTVTTLVQATMTAPSAGSNQIAIELVSPVGTTSDAITAWVTAGVAGLGLPTVPSITVNSVTIF